MAENEINEPPPYAAPAPYRTVTTEQRRIWETKGRRAIAFGALWLVGGLLLTLITYTNASESGYGGVYVVAWGPMLYGIYRIVSGARLLNKGKAM